MAVGQVMLGHRVAVGCGAPCGHAGRFSQGILPQAVKLHVIRQNVASRGSNYREDIFFDEDLVYLYDEFYSPGKMSSRSWCLFAGLIPFEGYRRSGRGVRSHHLLPYAGYFSICGSVAGVTRRCERGSVAGVTRRCERGGVAGVTRRAPGRLG